jgi:hypothetical protein
MAYCTNAELTLLTGTSLSTAVQDEIIDHVDREINGRLSLMGISAPTSNDTLKAASLNFSIIAVWTHPDSEVASAVKLGDISIKKADISAEVSKLAKRAWQSVDDYIMQNGADDPYRYYIRKVN